MARRQRAGPPRAGAGPDVHAQGRGPARRPRAAPAAGARVLEPARRARPDGRPAPGGPRRRADDLDLPRLRRAPARRARSAPARRPRRAPALAHRVVAARAPHRVDLGRGPRHRPRALHRHRARAVAGRASSASTSPTPARWRSTPSASPARWRTPRAPRARRRRCRWRWPTRSPRNGSGRRSCRWSASFAERKRAERCLDFADQMAAAARLAESHDEVGAAEREAFRAVLLDEYQDTGHAQRIMLRSLFSNDEGTSVTAVGDPLPVDLRLARRERGEPAAVRHRLPARRPRRRDRRGRPPRLLTSFRNPPEVLALANGIAEPLRASGVPVSTSCGPAPARRPATCASPCTTTSRPSGAWLADAVADRWRAAADADTSRRPPRCSCAGAPTWRRSPPRCAPVIARRGRRPGRAARRARDARRRVGAAARGRSPGRRPAVRG